MKELLAGLPEDAGDRAVRARRRALARLGEEVRSQKSEVRIRWTPAVVALTAVLVVGIVWFRQAWRVEALAWQPPAPVIRVPEAPVLQAPKPARPQPNGPERLQLQLALSDGTRVYWTFDKNFYLKGAL